MVTVNDYIIIKNMKIFITPANTDKPWHSNCSYAEPWLMTEYLGPRHSDSACDYIWITFNDAVGGDDITF